MSYIQSARVQHHFIYTHIVRFRYMHSNKDKYKHDLVLSWIRQGTLHLWHHMTKSHVTCCFSYLHQMNKIVPLIMPLASHDTNAGTNDITWLKKSCFTLFWLLWPNEGNSAIDSTIAIPKTCLDTKRHVYTFRYV